MSEEGPKFQNRDGMMDEQAERLKCLNCQNGFAFKNRENAPKMCPWCGEETLRDPRISFEGQQPDEVWLVLQKEQMDCMKEVMGCAAV